MTTPAYDIGDLKRIPGIFTDGDGNLADPSTVTFKITEPDGVTTSFIYLTDAELVRDSLGSYHVDWMCAKAGRHFVAWIGTGAVAASAPFEFYALRSQTA